MSDLATIIPVEAEAVGQVFPLVSGFIEDALEHSDNEISLTGILSDIANRKRQLFVVEHGGSLIAAIITQIYTTQTGKRIGEITLAGGLRQETWAHFPDLVEDWFKSEGCSAVDIVGRAGWQRRYRDRGFKLKYVVLRRDI